MQYINRIGKEPRMKPRSNKSVTVCIRVTPETKQALREAAGREKRSVTSLIETLLDRHLKAH
jgi:predicted HicB family RNase H-like nuclease